VSFPDKTAEDKSFVEDLWARRKVGYLLDEIRRNGQKKELVDEVVTLAKRYGITTPYTSYLVVPDAPVPVAGGGFRGVNRPMSVNGAALPAGLAPRDAAKGAALKVETFAREMQKEKGELQGSRGRFQDKNLKDQEEEETKSGDSKKAKATAEARGQKRAFDQAREMLLRRKLDEVQAGQLGVDLSVQTDHLRNQIRLTQNAQQRVQNRNVLEVGGVWIDEGFDAKTPIVTVKAMSPAYFRILERHPAVRDVFRLGNYVVWIAPSGTALVVDTQAGNQQMSDADIDRLFAVKKQ
jgi:Ca-activated chloride channel family protein